MGYVGQMDLLSLLKAVVEWCSTTPASAFSCFSKWSFLRDHNFFFMGGRFCRTCLPTGAAGQEQPLKSRPAYEYRNFYSYFLSGCLANCTSSVVVL